MAKQKILTGEVLPSGRGVKYRPIGTTAMLDIAERFGEKSARAAREFVILSIAEVTRGPLPKKTKTVDVEQPSPVTGDLEVVKVEVIDEAAMLAAADEGAGGGWVTVTEQMLRTVRDDNDFSFVALFEDETADFTQLATSIGEVSGLGNLKRGGPVTRVPFVAR